MRWVTPPPPLRGYKLHKILFFLRSLYILCFLFALITWIQIVLITLCPNNSLILHIQEFRSISWPSTVRAPVFGRHQVFGTSEHYGKAHGSLLSGWMNYYYTACCWFPTSSNILILPLQFWQIRFESYWLDCSKCRILVLLRYTACCWFPTSNNILILPS